MASTRPLDDNLADDRLSDAELIAQLRSGDHRAYEALWSRHVAAALRLARRYDLQQAEDLVSESFLAVYDQIAVAGNGPETAFRAYLFTVIRNAAAKTARHGQQVISDPEIDTVDTNDGLTILAREEDAADLLESFKALPERWQRVLWLAEVDQVPRGAIAQELGIRPNAVSALLRRARSGLQYHWLLQRVPSALQSDPTHVARFLPAYITGGKIEASKTSVLVHLQRCETCRHVHEELSLAHGRMRKTMLSVSGFAALSVTLPTSTPVPAAAAASLLAVFGAGTALSGVGVTAVVAGGALVATLVAGAPFGAQDDRTPGASDSAVTDDAAQRVAERPPGFAQRPPGVEETPMPIPPAPEGVEAVEAEERPTRPGRGDSSTPLPELDLEFDFDTLVTPPARPPAPQPVSVAPEPDPDSPERRIRPPSL
ncbi:RNA polymerase sigma factor [Microbacterium sp. NIBRBAC000506063]|uniref:RNA polymerase sigma factor n=1 Tax=Microbacterium sp. NIBRBAC000506063 TaxID=2734618 RepID=UPI001BB65FC7|nr:sigma-70 family RNA polymerase sigma factor [Microbacterium sp. NIBRBAC000506063]QTV80279.1 sigma-70 family RNA polymerase sigma factor [Microbacterium sp. NIBRBAC000506063]